MLRRFVNDRGKLRARSATGNCVEHQRDVAIAIEIARALALLVYTSADAAGVSTRGADLGSVLTAEEGSAPTRAGSAVSQPEASDSGLADRKTAKPGGERASTQTDTQAAAVARAKEIVNNASGGEVRVHGSDGAVRDIGSAAPSEGARRRAIVARASRELANLECDRAALLCVDHGLARREIAALLDVSQTEVHRMLRRLRADAQLPSRSLPREVLLKLTVGSMARATALKALQNLSRAESGPAPDPEGEGHRPGVWDAIRDAYLDKLLSEEVYEWLRRGLWMGSESVPGMHGFSARGKK